ncbi:hypothetical protein [Vibrio anguillarum]|nr:hypothetical protein [Vibrio anguillarum]
MKFTYVLLGLLLLIGCSSTPPKAPEPKGDLTPINPSKVIYDDLVI